MLCLYTRSRIRLFLFIIRSMPAKLRRKRRLRALVLQEVEEYLDRYRQEILVEFPKAHPYIETTGFLAKLTEELAGLTTPDANMRLLKEVHKILLDQFPLSVIILSIIVYILFLKVLLSLSACAKEDAAETRQEVTSAEEARRRSIPLPLPQQDLWFPTLVLKWNLGPQYSLPGYTSSSSSSELAPILI